MPIRRLNSAPALALLLLGCATSTVDYGQRCDVVLDSVQGAVVQPGQALNLVGGPLTKAYDTTVTIGDLDAPVADVQRTDCEACDSCRDDAGCTACSDCDSCDAECTDICVESVIVTVPDLPDGPAALVLFNAYGATQPQTVEVQGGVGASDTGPADAEALPPAPTAGP